MLEPHSPPLPADESEVLAWARDADTGAAVHVCQLPRDRSGRKCGCECPGCDAALDAVNAGKALKDCKKRPHFRHPEGKTNLNCLSPAARWLLLERLSREKYLQLPRRRRSAKSIGLSNTEYETWKDHPAESLAIRGVSFVDSTRAVFRLENGEDVVVLVRARTDAEEQDPNEPPRTLLEIVIDPETVLTATPEELAGRLKSLSSEDACWRFHWMDAALDRLAGKDAEVKAADRLDFSPEGGTRESLLHSEAKKIIAGTSHLQLPALVLSMAEQEPVIIADAQRVEISSTVLEKRLVTLQPDVILTLATPHQCHVTIHVEVTVTHGIDAARQERFRNTGVPTIEIDLSTLGGWVTREEFARLIQDEVVAKTWAYHPAVDRAAADFAVQPDERPESLAKRVVDAMRAYGDRIRASSGDADTRGWIERRLAEHLAVHLSPDAPAIHPELVHRLLSMHEDRAVGYRMTTAWQVINALKQESHPSRTVWHPYCLMAIRAWNPTLDDSQREAVEKWRRTVWASVSSGDMNPSARLDRQVTLLFPDLEPLIRRFRSLQAQAPSSSSESRRSSEPARSVSQEDVQPYRRFHFPRREDLFLKGRALEEWKCRNPEWAKSWEDSLNERAREEEKSTGDGDNPVPPP